MVWSDAESFLFFCFFVSGGLSVCGMLGWYSSVAFSSGRDGESWVVVERVRG